MKGVSNERREANCAEHRGGKWKNSPHPHKHESDAAAYYYSDQRKESRRLADVCLGAVESSRDGQSGQELNGNEETSDHIMRRRLLFVAHSRIRESCHLTKQFRRTFNDVHRQGRSGAFT